jgi:alkaline phosphatase D
MKLNQFQVRESVGTAHAVAMVNVDDTKGAMGMYVGGTGVGRLSRRSFIGAAVAAAAATKAPWRAAAAGRRLTVPPDLPAGLFTLGVASGDPLPDSVILWTRLVPDPVRADGMPDVPVPVQWSVATDEEFGEVVATGEAVADPAFAHSVHVDATGLEPDTWYWYRFSVGDAVSPVGRTRTAPAIGTDVERLNFAFASCQNFQNGFFTAYQHLAGEDLDLVLFLGDYIYEDGPVTEGVARTYVTGAPTDLDGYRLRYGEYKADPLLQLAHARFPWVITWDDHEVQNNYAGDVPDGAGQEATPEMHARRAAAYQAFYEHMPLRLEPPDDGALTIYHDLSWGDLATFYVLDGRQYRTDQACDRPLDIGPTCAEVDDPEQTMLGAEQEAWLGERLAASATTWNVLVQGTMVARTLMSTDPLGGSDQPSLQFDQWDGYPVARERLLDQLAGASNPVILTGDYHAAFTAAVARASDPDTPVVPEFVTTGLSSKFGDAFLPWLDDMVASSPAIGYANGRQQGYCVCHVEPGSLRVDFRVVDTVDDPAAAIATDASFEVVAESPEIRGT